MTEDEVLELVPMQARVVARKFRGYVDMHDVVQEGYLYVLSKPKFFKGFFEDEEGEPVDGTEDAETAIRRHCERYCRKEKSSKVGYEIGDEYFYDSNGGTQLLADTLPYALADEWPAKPPFMEDNERVSGARPLHEGGNWTAMLADVATGVSKLDPADRYLLRLKYRDGEKQKDIALRIHRSEQWISDELQRVLRRLLEQLGGASPWH